MFEVLWRTAKTVFSLAEDLQRYHAELKEIRRELRDLTLIVHALGRELQHSKEINSKDRAALLLEIDNRLLKAERALPPAPKKSRKKGRKR